MHPMARGGAAWMAGIAIALLSLLGGVALQVGVPASAVPARHVPNHDGDFAVAAPPCRPSSPPPPDAGSVRIAYLGVGGVLIRWQGHGLLTAPFFSHYGHLAPVLGSIDWRDVAIDRGMSGLPLDNVHAVLVGHAHYDHLGDLPPVVRRWTPDATVYVNPSGAAMLAPYADTLRIRPTRPEPGGWIRPETPDGEPAPYRFLPVRSEHAPHFPGVRYARGALERAWREDWPGRPLRDFVDGDTLAFVIELLDPASDRVAFRIHYQDSASPPPAGMPPAETVPEAGLDLAILCVPSAHLVSGYPERLLQRTRPGHVMAIHWESFFRDSAAPLRFAPSLTRGRLGGFLQALADRPGARRAGPAPRCGCGPCGPAWSLPLPGDWLALRASQ